jgi:hypothetical protein
VARGAGASDAAREAERDEEVNAATALRDSSAKRPCFLVCTPEKIGVDRQKPSVVMSLLQECHAR